ncbi:MAG: hypothetical protein M3Q29_17270 [Chloroflexota bacterium]|nr:hypothetical protein [Chloroflexota bacterium]
MSGMQDLAAGLSIVRIVTLGVTAAVVVPSPEFVHVVPSGPVYPHGTPLE